LFKHCVVEKCQGAFSTRLLVLPAFRAVGKAIAAESDRWPPSFLDFKPAVVINAECRTWQAAMERSATAAAPASEETWPS